MRAKRGFFAAFGLRSHNNLQKIYDWDGNFEFIREVWTDSSRGHGGRRRAHDTGEGRRAQRSGGGRPGRGARRKRWLRPPGFGGGIRAGGGIWMGEKRCSAMGVPAGPAAETPGTTGKRRPLPGGRRKGVQKIYRMITKNGISP